MRILIVGLASLLVLAAAAPAQPAPPREARRAFEKAAAAAKAKRTADAIAGYEQAVALFPEYAEAWYELGRLRLEANQSAAARSALDAAIKADPNFASPYMTLAILEHAAGNWKHLIQVTDELLRIGAIDFPQAWILNAVGNYNTRNFEAAEKSAREAERLDTLRKFPECWSLLGMILTQRGDFGGAADQFRQYLAIASEGPGKDSIRTKLADTEKRAADAAPSPADAGPTFRADTELAVVRFQVRPPKGQLPRDLVPEDIEIREDGVPRKIAVFEGSRAVTHTVPVEVSLLFDCSASVERVSALNQRVFRENLLDEFPNVSIAVYGFSDTLVRLSTPTRDANALKKAMDRAFSIPPRDTPLFGSIANTIRDASATGANIIRLVVIFSDGESVWPGDLNRAGEAERAAEESGASLFPVMLASSGAAANSADSIDSIRQFLSLGQATGGRTFEGFMGTDVLPNILKSIAREIRTDYVAGFYLSSSGGRKAHRMEVILRSKDRGQLSGGRRILIY